MPVKDAEFQAALDAMISRVSVASRVISVKGGAIIQRAGMAHTRVRSGTLRRSWRTEQLGGTGGVFTTRVGPTMVYARRQELGFVGADSLGRVYNEPQHIGSPGAYGSKRRRNPYVKPGVVEATPLVGVLARETWAAALRG